MNKVILMGRLTRDPEVRYSQGERSMVYKVDEEAAKRWLANGAQPTDVVAKIFKLAGIEK